MINSLFRLTINVLIFVCLTIQASQAAASLPVAHVLSNQSYGRLLNWVNQRNQINLCGGYYVDHPIPFQPNPNQKDQTHFYNIQSDRATYSPNGTSVLTGHVRITQSDKQFNADQVKLYRNSKTGKVSLIHAKGNVRVFSPGSLLIGEQGSLNVERNQFQLYNAVYRNVVPTEASSVTKQLPSGLVEYRRYQRNYWGHAYQVKQLQPHVFEFKHATFSTCPPKAGSCAWKLHTSTLRINKVTQIGKVWNAVLYVKKVPVFYFPYLNFALSHERKTGFLTPSYGYTQSSGEQIAAPFYWNLAPNYDWLITPVYMQERALLINNTFRYLFPDYAGSIHFNVLPHDRKFARYRRDADYPQYPDGMKKLRQDSNTRYLFSFSNSSVFNKHWHANVDYTKVSDDDYILDMSRSLTVNDNQNELLQSASVQYNDEYLNGFALFQGYQTLHPMKLASIQNQYARLPEFQFSFSKPNFFNHFNGSVSFDTVNFQKTPAPDVANQDIVKGQRYTMNPSLTYAMQGVSGYLVPKLQLQFNQYALTQPSNNGMPDTPTLAIPLFDTEAGLYFFRDFHWFHGEYRQTLEPKLFYLYVPYVKQNKFPVFDTSVQPFSYSSLFLDNRFTGVDRVGDANQVSYALTSRFLDQDTGAERGDISFGGTVYFENRRVSLCTGQDANCTDTNPLDRRMFSPLTGQLNYNFSNQWSASGNLTWDFYSDQFSYENMGMNYKPTAHHLLNLSYSRVLSGGEIAGLPEGTPSDKLQEVNINGEWKFMRRLDFVGKVDYLWHGDSPSEGHGTAYLGGIEYDSCCWAVRFVALRSFLGVTNTGRNKFQNAFYVQFDLRGLGTVGNNDPTHILQTNISGYQNTFDKMISE